MEVNLSNVNLKIRDVKLVRFVQSVSEVQDSYFKTQSGLEVLFDFISPSQIGDVICEPDLPSPFNYNLLEDVD